MTLQYLNGDTIEAVLLSRTDLVMRVAPEGFEDAMELKCVNGDWVADDSQPVQVRFAWEIPAAEAVSDADFICSPGLAARLIEILYADNATHDQATPKTRAAGGSFSSSS